MGKEWRKEKQYEKKKPALVPRKKTRGEEIQDIMKDYGF